VTDLDRIYATILDRPDDDFPRLAYADALEGQAGTVTCQRCGGDGQSHLASRSGGSLGWGDCPTCNGSGEVSNGFAERAEFVRVQVELARMPAMIPAGTLMGYGPDGQLAPYNPDVAGMSYPVAVSGTCPPGRYHELRRRERELWAPPLNREMIKAAQNLGLATLILPGMATPNDQIYRAWGEVSRGFVDAIRCDLRTWCGGECERCYSGIVETRTGPELGSRVYSRDDCDSCHGTGRVTGIGPAVVRAHPVRRVVTDREPWRNEDGSFSWWMMYEGTTEERADIHEKVWKLLPHVDGFGFGRPTRAAALDSLSAALLAWAKGAPVA
jgi:uncharacterized protein (TIGR02996 family)